jgi:hypothetical protein
MMGIYCYKDTQKNNEIVYIGKDSYINKHKRHTYHNAPSCYNNQQINRVLQNNPNRYKYEVLKAWDKKKYNEKLASALEIIYIRRYNPIFNFTKGGEGLLGVKLSEETRKKISNAKKGKSFSEEHKQNLSKALKGRKLSPEHCKNMGDARKGELNSSFKGYFRIIKNGTRAGKQYYAIVKVKKDGVVKQSNSINKLIEWFKTNYPDEELRLNGDSICLPKIN